MPSGTARSTAGSRSAPAPKERRPNRAATQRVVRLSLIYLVALATVYLLMVGFARSTPAGAGTGTESALALFSGVAALLAAGGVVFSLSAAPRALEVGPESIVVVGRWGGRREYAPRSEIRVRVLRRFPPSLLAPARVESVEVRVPGKPSRTYLVDQELFPVPSS